MSKNCETPQKAAIEVEKSNEIHNKDNTSDPWGNQDIHIVDNIKTCQQVMKQLQLHCKEYNVLGIGCELVKHMSDKITLLLLASHRGLCALVRLYNLTYIPTELRHILENKNIIKVGFNVVDVAIKLTDYDVRIESILDLRYLTPIRYKNLRILSRDYLKIRIDDYKSLQQHHWKRLTNRLDKRNINNAAKNVRVTIELFKKFQENFMLENSLDTPLTTGVQRFIDENCKDFLNQIHRYSLSNIKKSTDGNETKAEQVHVVSNANQCRTVLDQLLVHCTEYKVLGFSCMCTTSKNTVTLLQLASYRGLCVLIKLRQLKTIPTKLQEILEDRRILKIGNKVSFNVKRLEADYGVHVESAIDIQYLAKECKYPSNNLAQLSEKYLNIDIETLDWRLLHTDWRTNKCSHDAINYAAKFVRVTIELFKLFEKKLLAEKYSGDRIKFLDELCSSHSNENKPKTSEVVDEGQEINSTCTLPKQEIRIVSNAEECKDVAVQLRSHCNEYNVLGFDCETKSPGGYNVALLQLASHRGLCALIRLCKLKRIPTELQTILDDERILKVGIMPHTDANKLFRDYQIKVSGTLDLKILSKKCEYKACGLGSLSEEVLKIKLSHKISGLMTRNLHKKWENHTLDEENIKYAADDAHVSVELFKKFQEQLMSTNQSSDQTKDVQQFIDEHCKFYEVKERKQKQKKKKNKNRTETCTDINKIPSE